MTGTVSVITQSLVVMRVLVSTSRLHQMLTIILSLWTQQMHQISREVLPITSVLLHALTSVTLYVIAMAVRNQPNSVESQRPFKCVSKHLSFCFLLMQYHSLIPRLGGLGSRLAVPL